MTPEIFTAAVRGEIIEGNVELYRQLYLATPAEVEKDAHWSKAIALFQSLTAEQQETFFAVLRQTSLETVFNVFAVLDGAAAVGGQQGTVALVQRDSGSNLSGRLVELLLELEQDAPDGAIY